MINVRCYEMKEGTFDGPIANRWVQIFIDENFEDECDTDSPYYFYDGQEELEGVSVFTTDPDFWSKVENLMKTREMVMKYAPKFILITEYKNQFLEIIKNSIKIPEIDYEITSEREMVHYALLKDNTSQVLLVAV